MNPEIKGRWIAALRSGEYTQAEEFLSIDGSFCCLGVLCELAVQDGVITKEIIPVPMHPDSEITTYTGPNSEEYAVLPMDVVDWAGLKDANPYVDVSVDGQPYPEPLSEVNDDRKYTFDQIADLIEEQL